jgi:hypothetical protein
MLHRTWNHQRGPACEVKTAVAGNRKAQTSLRHKQKPDPHSLQRHLALMGGESSSSKCCCLTVTVELQGPPQVVPTLVPPSE